MRLCYFKLWNYTKIIGGMLLLNSTSEKDCKLFLEILFSIVAHTLKLFDNFCQVLSSIIKKSEKLIKLH